MTDFVPAYMGEFLKDERPYYNLNTVVNHVFTRSTKFLASAAITQEVMFPDVSFYQGEINYDVMAENTDAIVLRAGQNTWVDTQFERNYAEAKRKGLKVGVYWFYDGRASPGEQAGLLISLLKDKTLELEVFIDWERNYGGPFEGLKNVVAMMQAIERAGLKIKGVGIYTGYYFFRSNTNAITNASQYEYLKSKPLWLAWYTNRMSEVLIPAPWSFLTIWQFGTPSLNWGQATVEIDMNWFNGSKADFGSRYGNVVEKPMETHVKLTPTVATEYRSIRRPVAYPQTPHIMGSTFARIEPGAFAVAAPADFYVYASNITYNNVVQAYAGDKWWKVRVGDQDGWVAEIHKGVRWLNAELVEPTPTQTLPELPWRFEIGDDVTYEKYVVSGILKPKA